MKKELNNLIENHKRFLLTTHLNPDGDGIGGAAALSELLISLGKKVRFVSPSPIPKQFSFLDFRFLHEVYEEGMDFSDIEVMIVLDTHEIERIGPLEKVIRGNKRVILSCIDHHRPLKEPLFPIHWIDPDACSTGALVFTLFNIWKIPLNLNAAKGIYTSILCDTGRFSYASTNSEAHRIAELCIHAGVDPDEMYSKIFQHVSFEEIKMCARVLQKMETYFDKKVVILQIEQRDCEKSVDIENLDLEYFLEFNKLIENVECVLLLRELGNGEIRVSLRSKEIDVAHILKGLGGGGHARAAGLLWKGSLDDVKEKLLLNLTDNILENIQRR